MSTGRLKDQKDYDLEQIVKIIDTALESDDQRIKDALRQLMTITVLCTAEHPGQALRNGPLARVLEDMRNLNQRIGCLEDDMRKLQWDQQKKQVEPFTSPYQPPTSPWDPRTYPPSSPWASPNDPTKPKPMWGPSMTSTDVGEIKTWSAGDDPNYKGSSATSFSQADLDLLLGVK